jgi:adhesin/invasin
VSVVGTATFTGPAGEALATPLRVRVADAGGSPLEGQTVTFSVTGGGGSVAPTTSTTNSSGEATAVWTLGTATGQQTAQAAVAGVSAPATFVAVSSAGAPSAITINAGNNQTGQAGASVGIAPSVRLRDRFGNNVAGVSVFFSVSAGGGSVTGSGATTNAEGIATVGSWQLGPNVGVNRLTALAVFNGVQGNPVEFTATAAAGPANRVTALTATTINQVVGTNVSPLPSIRVTDAAGNPVAGVQVTFAGSTGSTVNGTTKQTSADGVATVDGWLLGTAVQTYTLTATVPGILTPTVFTATTRASSAASVTAVAGNGQTAFVGRPVDIEPSVRVNDAFGNPIAGAEVVFTVVAGGGSAVARTQITNAAGIATVGGWTLGETPGANTLRATVTGTGIAGNPVNFNATATPGLPATIAVQAGAGQSAQVSTALPISPAVVVRDNRGNPVANVNVLFLVGTGGGTLTGAQAQTNASGVATVGSWTLGGATGTQTLIARIAGLPDVIFTATATPGVPNAVTPVNALSYGPVLANGLVAPAPSVVVRDVGGNPLGNVTVTFQLEDAGSGVVTGATVVTDANGVAQVGSWRVGTVAGTTSSLRVFVTGLDQAGNEIVFSASVIAGAPTTMTASPAAVVNQTNLPNTGGAVPTAPGVRLTDLYGNPVANVAVLFVPQIGSGTVNSGAPNITIFTGVDGIATLTDWTIPAGGSATRQLAVTLPGFPAIPLVAFSATTVP